ncbi:MAG: hydroxymethylbilane synthase [Planctomycetia bacterium]|nr:hydroxymethylbilane synthase [Planctomycetia bacterium]
MAVIRLGARPSQLSMWQVNWCAQALRAQGRQVEVVPIHTSGDIDRSSVIANLGAQGVFTKEIQRALLNGEIDAAVHSLKDLPVEKIPGLTLAATPKREEPYDVFVSTKYPTLEELPPGATIGTGSLRRVSMALRYCAKLYPEKPQWRAMPTRGNVETRLKKLQDGEYDALILASAGLKRLGLQSKYCVKLNAPDFLPAVGQGALGLEIRQDASDDIRQAVTSLNDETTYLCVQAERSFLATLQGGCLMPIGAHAQLVPGENDLDVLILQAQILSFDGQESHSTQSLQFLPRVDDSNALPFSTKVSLAQLLGVNAANNIMEQGASELVERIRAERQSHAPQASQSGQTTVDLKQDAPETRRSKQ